ncbi:MAG: ankyrin repeat domain-containing protein [Akkermansia sp.]|nr:ankyrin repeat domain-containing protein [Akkermansia sp.]
MKYSLLTTTALCALLAGGMSACKKEASNLPAAAAQGDLETVKDMVEDGVDIDAKEVKLGGTSLHEASAAGHAEVVLYLLEHGADPTVRDKKGETPLFRAVRNGHNEVVKVYAEKLGRKMQTEADPQKTDVHCNPAGSTLLLPAAWGGHAEVVQTLLAAGVDPNKADANGNTALLFAVRQFPVAKDAALTAEETKLAEQYRAMLGTLLKHTPAVDVNAADITGNTALISAAR